MIEQLYNLKVFQVLKEEKEYQAVFDKRIAKLNNWKSKVSAAKLKRGFDACIKLSKESHQTAKKLLKVRNEFANSFPFFDSIADALDSVISLQNEGLRKSDNYKEWKKYKEMEDTQKILREAQVKARSIVLEALEGKVKEDISLLELINRRAQDYEPLMLAQLKTEVYLQYSGFQMLERLLSSSPHIIQTLDLYRGLLYMGIVNIEGGKLDQKALWDRAASIGENVVGFIPVIGNIVGAIKTTNEIFKFIQEFRGVDIPDIIDNAQFVESFFSKYQIVLNLWMTTAQVYIYTTKSMTKSLKQYKVRKKI